MGRKLFYGSIVAALISLASGNLGHTAQAQPPAEADSRVVPALPPADTFLKDVAESIRELAKTLRESNPLRVELNASIGTNVLAAIALICFTVIICAPIVGRVRERREAH